MTREEVLKVIYAKGRLVNMADVQFLDSPQSNVDIHLWMHKIRFPESQRKKEDKMERVKIEIPLACGCSITERLDPLNSGELLRPIYSKHVLQNDAVKNTQYITFNRSPHCTEHNSKKKNNKLTVEKIKNIIRLNFPERLSSEDVDDLYNFLESRRR